MILVVNKMSDEAGEEVQKIANYRNSLAEAIKPYSLDEFPICFIDAKDYCEGVDTDEDFLIEASRFQTFIDALNNFVQNRAALTRFDTPVRIALACLDEAQLSFTRNSSRDLAFLEALTRLSRTVRKERDRLRTKVQRIALEMSSAIAKEGTTLSTAVGSEQNFEMLSKQADLNVQKHYEQAEAKRQEAFDAAVEDIRQEVEQVLASHLVQAFIACLDKNQNISAQNVETAMDLERIKGQVASLTNIGQTVGVEVTKLAMRSFAKTAGQNFLRSIDVAGGGLHQGVLAARKFVGFKFKPWQAVGVAKNIGNAAKFLGPGLALVSLGVDGWQMHQEHQREKQMADCRRDITSQSQAIGKELENQIELQLWEFEQQVYGDIDKSIATARHQEETAIAASNQWVKQLLDIRKDFEEILRDVTEATNTTVA